MHIKKKIEELGWNLLEPKTTKMKGNNSFHKIRIEKYLIIYEIHEGRLVILIVKIGYGKNGSNRPWKGNSGWYKR